jgi:hypothetical protein
MGDCKVCGEEIGTNSFCPLCRYIITKQTNTAIEQLEQRNAELVAMLKKLEWHTIDYDGQDNPIKACIVCRGREVKGHAPDCALQKLIKEG